MGLLNTVLDIDIVECTPDAFSPERIILQVIDFVTEIFGTISNIQNGTFHHATSTEGLLHRKCSSRVGEGVGVITGER